MQSDLESRLLKLERRIRVDGADLAGAGASARQIRSSTIALGEWSFGPYIPPPPSVPTRCCPAVPEALKLYHRDVAAGSPETFVADLNWNAANLRWEDGAGRRFRSLPTGRCFQLDLFGSTVDSDGACKPFVVSFLYGAVAGIYVVRAT